MNGVFSQCGILYFYCMDLNTSSTVDYWIIIIDALTITKTAAF